MKGVHLWLVPDPPVPTAVLAEHAATVLGPDELQRYQSHRLPKGQRSFLLTRLALRTLLSHHHPGMGPADWRFSRSPGGKPQIDHADIHTRFNLSHAGSLIALAFCEQSSIGVDIEHCDRVLDADSLSARYFSVNEHDGLMRLPAAIRRQRFLTLWTLKEAVVKASGLGLARALRDFEFIIDEHAGDLTFRQLRSGTGQFVTPHWDVCAAQSGEYHIALARSDVDDQSNLSADLQVRQFIWPQQIEVGELQMLYSARLSV